VKEGEGKGKGKKGRMKKWREGGMGILDWPLAADE